jgi:hypothetical protein
MNKIKSCEIQFEVFGILSGTPAWHLWNDMIDICILISNAIQVRYRDRRVEDRYCRVQIALTREILLCVFYLKNGAYI